MTGALLAVIGADTPVGYSVFGGVVCYDKINDQVYLIELAAATGGDGIKLLDVKTTGTELLQQLQATIYPGGETMSTQAVSYNNVRKQLFVSLTGGNSAPIGRIDAVTLTSVEVFGLANSSTAPSTQGPPARMLASSGFLSCWIDEGDHHNYLVSNSIFSEVAVLNVSSAISTMFLVYNANMPEGKAVLGGAVNGADCRFYVIGWTGSLVTAQPLNLYKFAITVDLSNNDVVTRTMFGALTVAEVDGTWDPRWGSFSAPGVDMADGNLVMTVQNFTGTAAYLLKLNATTGAVMWKIAVAQPTIMDLPNAVMNGQLIAHSLITNNSFAVIDLINGVVVAEMEFNGGLVVMEGQKYNGNVQGVLGGLSFGGYAQGAGPIPSYLGAFLAGSGNTTPNHRLVRAWPGVPNGQRSYVEVI